MRITKSNLKHIINEEYTKLLNEQSDWRERLRRQKEEALGQSGTGEDDWIQPETDFGDWSVLAVTNYGPGGKQRVQVRFGSDLHKYLHKILPQHIPPATKAEFWEMFGYGAILPEEARAKGLPDPKGPRVTVPGFHQAWGGWYRNDARQHLIRGEIEVTIPPELELDPKDITGTGYSKTFAVDTDETRDRLVKTLRAHTPERLKSMHTTAAREVSPGLHKAAAQWDPKKNIRSHDEYMMDILATDYGLWSFDPTAAELELGVSRPVDTHLGGRTYSDTGPEWDAFRKFHKLTQEADPYKPYSPHEP